MAKAWVEFDTGEQCTIDEYTAYDPGPFLKADEPTVRWVEEGEVVGHVGAARSTGPHLHWQVKGDITKANILNGYPDENGAVV